MMRGLRPQELSRDFATGGKPHLPLLLNQIYFPLRDGSVDCTNLPAAASGPSAPRCPALVCGRITSGGARLGGERQSGPALRLRYRVFERALRPRLHPASRWGAGWKVGRNAGPRATSSRSGTAHRAEKSLITHSRRASCSINSAHAKSIDRTFLAARPGDTSECSP